VPTVSAVVLSYNRCEALALVLDRLAGLPVPVDEVVVVDNGSEDGSAEVARQRGATVIELSANTGIAGRNAGARAASGDYVLFLDDDSYPQPGAVEAMVDLLERQPGVAAVGGLVEEADSAAEPGSFDWWLRAADRRARAGRRRGDPGDGDLPAFFFPEGASMVRRHAFLASGGFYEPFFFTNEAFDLTTRLLGAGWDVRYLPAARFFHLRAPAGRAPVYESHVLFVRNHLWYFWRHFPWPMALPRMVAYGLYDLLFAVHLGTPGAWARGVRAAWAERAPVRGSRRPLPPAVLRRAELGRARAHVAFVAHGAGERLRRARLRGLRAPGQP
jgi:hypothetical protein